MHYSLTNSADLLIASFLHSFSRIFWQFLTFVSSKYGQLIYALLAPLLTRSHWRARIVRMLLLVNIAYKHVRLVSCLSLELLMQHAKGPLGIKMCVKSTSCRQPFISLYINSGPFKCCLPLVLGPHL